MPGVRRRLEGSIDLPSGKLLLSLTIDLGAQELQVTLTRADGAPVALADLEPREAVGVELVAFRNLWLHVGRTDPVARADIAAVEALVARVPRPF